MLARLIVHEGTHKFFGAHDHAYAWHHPANGISEADRYKNLPKEDALENADSYAYTVVCLAQKKLITKMVDNIGKDD